MILYKILILSTITMLPVFELRASIPLGLIRYNEIHPAIVVTICIISNILIAPVVYLMFYNMLMLACKIKKVNTLYTAYNNRVVRKIKPKIDRFGFIGLALFIGIPIPGSGVYSGAIGAHALGLSLKKYMISAVIGVIIAAALVTAIVVSGNQFLQFFLNRSLLPR